MEIVAHRGVTDKAPENTIPAFKRAIELGADAVEMDVRLTADRIPVVFHDTSLGRITSVSGKVARHTLAQLKAARFPKHGGCEASIPTFQEVMDAVGGRIGMQIEIKGPDPETPKIAGDILRAFPSAWDAMEIISFEPALLLAFQASCPGLKIGLLAPRFGFWMRPDAAVSRVLGRAGQVRAQAVHLHASQLSAKTVAAVRRLGLELHAWDVNDTPLCRKALAWGISSICTDQFLIMAKCVRESEGANSKDVRGSSGI